MAIGVDRCVCGDLTSEGDGNSKKKSKKVAAECMLEKLKALDQPTVQPKQRVKNVANKKKNRNLIKVSLHPIFLFLDSIRQYTKA